MTRACSQALAGCALAAVLAPGLALAAVPEPLTPGHAVRKALAPGEAHDYVLWLAAGDFLQASVRREDLAIEVAVEGPDAERLREGSLSESYRGVEPVSAIAKVSGWHRIEVRAPQLGASVGHYVLETLLPQPPSASSLERWAAERAMVAGQQHARRQQTESSRKALASFEAARAGFKRLAEGVREAEALLELASTRRRLGEYREAIELTQQALGLGERAGDPHVVLRAQLALGELMYYVGDYPSARERFEGVLVATRGTGDRRGQAEALSNLSAVASERGETESALQLAGEALALWRAIGHRRSEVEALSVVGYAHFNRGEYQQALDWFLQGLPLRRELRDREGESATLANVGSTYLHLGDPERAIEYFDQALPILRHIGQRDGEAACLSNSGRAHERLGDLDKALDHYRRALALNEATGDRHDVAAGLVYIGSLHLRRNEPEQALDFARRALAALDALPGERLERSRALALLGRVLAARGDRAAARGHFEEALALTRALADRPAEAEALDQLARLSLESGAPLEARRLSESALEIVESYRTTVRSEALRASFTASVRQMYERSIEVLLQLHESEPDRGWGAEALRASERARARSLLDLLASTGVDVRQGADAALLDAEHRAKRRLALELDRQMRLLSRRHTAGEAQAAKSVVASATSEYEQALGLLRSASPRYAALVQPQPVTVDEIQERVVDDQTVLLEYALGESGGVLWAVTPDATLIRRLPGRATIEALARTAHERLSSATRTNEQERGLADALTRLSDMLLRPVAASLPGRRIVVIPDGALHYLPFGALPDPGVPGRPLIASHEVVALPSASVLLTLRNELSSRPRAPKTLAVLADPVFDRSDERVGRASSAPPQRQRSARLERASRDAGLLAGFPRLIFTRREARAILALVPPGERREALDFDASRDALLEPGLADYRMLHIATHGFFNDAHPEFSGLVLSLVDRQGREQEGFLTPPDVFNLRLGADLVVLSGCRTGLGKEIQGEGLVGLTRAFMYAGSPRVLASLWRVDDAVTAELMTRFYRGLLQDGLRPAAALRRAQLSLAEHASWRSPSVWAAFQLHGEWR